MIRITLISLAAVCALTVIGVSVGTMIYGTIAAGAKCERSTLAVKCRWEW